MYTYLYLGVFKAPISACVSVFRLTLHSTRSRNSEFSTSDQETLFLNSLFRIGDLGRSLQILQVPPSSPRER